MPTLAAATPLVSLDAVVLDTETTGLDARQARVVQLGAVLIEQGTLRPEQTLSTLVSPGLEIPASATAVHGITTAALEKAPPFSEAWPRFLAFAGDRVLIGHALGFDLAILKRECRLAGLEFARPRALDTSLLAQIANPRLPDASLDTVASWLGIKIDDRHTGIGDALGTARIFLALVPRLRERNIRTLAEAEAACSRLAEVLEEQYKAGWIDVASEPKPDPSEFARIDAYPYRHRVRDVMTHPPAMVEPEAALSVAIAQMMTKRVSSLFVSQGDPEGLGIITERDVLRALAAQGSEALAHAVSEFASRPLVTVPEDAFIYRAIGRMTNHRIRHLGVIDEEGQIVGAVSARDLLRLRASEALSLGDEIDEASAAPALSRAWAKTPAIAKSLIAEAVPATDIAAVISREIGAMTRRAAILAEEALAAEGLGGPPDKYAVFVLGSSGRGESLLAADQDNALVYEDGTWGQAEAWFSAFGDRLSRILDESGVPLCKGGVMAKNPAWRGSLSEWRGRVDNWIRRSRPADLLNVDIFFDLRAVHGDARLAAALRDHAFRAARPALGFAKLLAEQASGFEPSIGLFGGIRTESGRIDLKKSGLFPIVSAARALAIRHDVRARSTRERLEGLRKRGLGGAPDLSELGRIHGRLLVLVLNQQIADIEAGLPPSYQVRLRALDSAAEASLRRDLAQIAKLPNLVRDLLF